MRNLSLILFFSFSYKNRDALASLTIAKVHIGHCYPETVPERKAEYELGLAVWGKNISSVTVEGPKIPLSNLAFEETEDTKEWRWTKSVNLPGKPCGLYFCTLKANGFTETKKMLLVK